MSQLLGFFSTVYDKTQMLQLVHILIHPFDNYVIWPGGLALMNREPITLRNLLMRAMLQDQKDVGEGVFN